MKETEREKGMRGGKGKTKKEKGREKKHRERKGNEGGKGKRKKDIEREKRK